MQKRTLVTLAATVTALATPTVALAQETEDPSAQPEAGSEETAVIQKPDLYADEDHVNGLSVFAILGFGLFDIGFGGGARYAFPLADGIITDSQQVRDEFALEFGLDVVYYFQDDPLNADNTLNTVQFLPVVGALWNFWIADGTVGIYPKFEIGYEFYADDDPLWENSFYWDVVGGVIWNVGDSGLTLRGEVSQDLLRFGVAFGF